MEKTKDKLDSIIINNNTPKIKINKSRNLTNILNPYNSINFNNCKTITNNKNINLFRYSNVISKYKNNQDINTLKDNDKKEIIFSDRCIKNNIFDNTNNIDNIISTNNVIQNKQSNYTNFNAKNYSKKINENNKSNIDLNLNLKFKKNVKLHSKLTIDKYPKNSSSKIIPYCYYNKINMNKINKNIDRSKLISILARSCINKKSKSKELKIINNSSSNSINYTNKSNNKFVFLSNQNNNIFKSYNYNLDCNSILNKDNINKSIHNSANLKLNSINNSYMSGINSLKVNYKLVSKLDKNQNKFINNNEELTRKSKSVEITSRIDKIKNMFKSYKLKSKLSLFKDNIFCINNVSSRYNKYNKNTKSLNNYYNSLLLSDKENNYKKYKAIKVKNILDTRFNFNNVCKSDRNLTRNSVSKLRAFSNKTANFNNVNWEQIKESLKLVIKEKKINNFDINK